MTIINTNNVRRLDDLGRVVIPKEIRRQLRLKEGDPLEIYVNEERQLILKKYSPIGELGDFAKEYANSLYESTGHIVIITDTDKIISVNGISEDEFLNQPIEIVCQGSEIIKVIENNLYHTHRSKELFDMVISPIRSGGDLIGTVVLTAKNRMVVMGDMEIKIAEVAAGFLAKQLEM
jgi:AbrB family transcriptional regulator (stage V sporulation protein T)